MVGYHLTDTGVRADGSFGPVVLPVTYPPRPPCPDAFRVRSRTVSGGTVSGRLGLDAAPASALALQPMVDVERFRILLQEERDRKLALLPALRGDIIAVNAARRDSNVDDEHDRRGCHDRLRTFPGIRAPGAEQGAYGICEVCGAVIPDGRLEARPWTPYCLQHSSGRA